MIENFEELKVQLKDLSEIVNGFKSEAVQLRIVEHVLGLRAGAEESDEEVSPQEKPKPAKKRGGKKPAKHMASKKSGKKPRGQGAVAILGKLVEESFFKTPKSINNIIAHCNLNLAKKFGANEFSGKLSRLVRDGALTRNKNADNQYEYQSK